LTRGSKFDLKILVSPHPVTELSAEQRREIARWIEQSLPGVPESVRVFLEPHCKYLNSEGDLRWPFDATYRELRRALGITPSSERRRSGSPLSSLPPEEARTAQTEEDRLEKQLNRSSRLEGWHGELKKRHRRRGKRIKKRLTKLKAAAKAGREQEPQVEEQEVTEDTPVEEIELTPEELAETQAHAIEFCKHLLQGDGSDPALQSVNETLMPGGSVVITEERESLAAELPEELANATVVETLHETRVRYDLTVSVSRIELDVEKKVVVTPSGDRAVVAASTSAFGPPRYSVTWSALATLAVLVGQFALPLNRLATMFSTSCKRFTAGGLGRMLHYVAQRLVPIYLEFSDQLSDSGILAGDDTSCRVIEVSSYFAATKPAEGSASKMARPPPWADYRTIEAAEQSLKRCEELQDARKRRRAEGERDARRTPDEDPSLGVVIGRVLEFESARQDGKGPKQSLNTTVISGRSVAEDPRSLIVFYRSHLGSCGNLLESILRSRDPSAREVILQADLSTTNLVSAPELLERFTFKLSGCSAHARRPFALYEHEDPVNCSYMLHLFKGLAIYEQRLDVHGRNRENVLAVRQAESRELWEDIRELATEMKDKWSKATKLGVGARYILKHYDKLTAYLDDPRLESTNNLRERMLRTEKLIENSSMFRRTLEGRFALDVVRTVMQTAVAAGVPVHEYLESVLRADAEDVAAHPERYTPRAWATDGANE
jgi:hypothetical protein